MIKKSVIEERERTGKGHWKKLAVCLLAAVLLLTACGGPSKSGTAGGSYSAAEEGAEAPRESYASWNASDSMADGDYDQGMETEEVEADEAYLAQPAMARASGGSAETAETDMGAEDSSNRKIIYSGNVSLQTLEYDKSSESIHDKITKYGGFIESEDTSNEDRYWYYTERPRSASKTSRHLNVTARIPAENFDAFMKDLENDGQVINTSVNARNISVRYATHDASRKALEIEQKRLLEMMDKAETVEDMIAVEQRLTEVERELNDEKTELSAMDRDVNFSTVYISLQEVFEYSEKVVEITYGEQLARAFSRAVEGFTDFWKNLILLIVEYFPFLIMLGIIIFILVKLGRRSRRRREEKLAEMRRAQAQAYGTMRGMQNPGQAQAFGGMPGGQNPGQAQAFTGRQEEKKHSFFKKAPFTGKQAPTQPQPGEGAAIEGQAPTQPGEGAGIEGKPPTQPHPGEGAEGAEKDPGQGQPPVKPE